MTDLEPGDELIDRVVERIMHGQDPDVEGLIASAPELAPDAREKLRKLAAAFGMASSGAPVLLPRDAELPFAELGPYALLSPMGEGGMGRVYLAEHRFLRRRVALKLIRPELALSPVTRQRFQREATSIARLRHENIVSVYDAGEHEGVAFLAMELVEGPGLDDVLRAAERAGERMDVATAARHARDIALALQCAHAAGIIHRDVKPANVRITADGRALLLDFGLSLVEEGTAISSLGQFRGTPQYASPEQIEPGTQELDARTDVYSLGVTLHECLTGQPPFANASMLQLFRQILEREPPEPRALNERVDEALNGIVLRAMAKRREDRFGSAGELARALDAWLRTAGVPAPPARRAPTGGRKRLAAAGVVAVGAATWLAVRYGGVGSTSERRADPSVEDAASLADTRTESHGDGDPAAVAARRATADGAGAPAAAERQSSPVVLPGPRTTTALLGGADRAFDQRLRAWDPLLGAGTFGADEDGPGVLGVCVEGACAAPYALPGGRGCVRGRVAPVPLRPGARTLGSGAGLEFPDGRIVALLLSSAADGYDVRVCELLRDGSSRLKRGAELEARAVPARDGRPLVFRLGWNETDTELDWSEADAPASDGSFLVPSALRSGARPSRFLLIVEQGSARFDDLVLEESG